MHQQPCSVRGSTTLKPHCTRPSRTKTPQHKRPYCSTRIATPQTLPVQHPTSPHTQTANHPRPPGSSPIPAAPPGLWGHQQGTAPTVPIPGGLRGPGSAVPEPPPVPRDPREEWGRLQCPAAPGVWLGLAPFQGRIVFSPFCQIYGKKMGSDFFLIFGVVRKKPQRAGTEGKRSPQPPGPCPVAVPGPTAWKSFCHLGWGWVRPPRIGDGEYFMRHRSVVASLLWMVANRAQIHLPPARASPGMDPAARGGLLSLSPIPCPCPQSLFPVPCPCPSGNALADGCMRRVVLPVPIVPKAGMGMGVWQVHSHHVSLSHGHQCPCSGM